MASPFLTINSLYKTPGASTWTVNYTLGWDTSVNWFSNDITINGFGPQGFFEDILNIPTLSTYASPSNNTITHTSVLDSSNTFLPITQDPTFSLSSAFSPWSSTNATIAGNNSAVLSSGGSISQNVTLVPGTYTINVSGVGTTDIYVDGFLIGIVSGSGSVQFICLQGKQNIKIVALSSATITSVTVSTNSIDQSNIQSPLIITALDAHGVSKVAILADTSNQLIPASDFITGAPQAYAFEVSAYVFG